MPLTVADLAGSGGVVPPLTVVTEVPATPEQIQPLIDAAKAMPKSASMQALLTDLDALAGKLATMRVGVANALAPLSDGETALIGIRSKILAAQMTENDPILRAKITSMTMYLDGVLARSSEVTRHLMTMEDGLRPLDTYAKDALKWAGDTGYTVTAPPPP